MSMLLTRAELQELTDCRRRDAQARVLAHLGIPFAARPDGSIAVLRMVVELMLGATPALSRPEPEVVLEPQLDFSPRKSKRRRTSAGG